MKRAPVALLGILLVATACGDGATATTAPATARCTPQPAMQLGAVADERLNEISGLVAGRRSDVLWVHNDSGDGPTIYAIDTKGALLATYTLESATAVDWEDIAFGPGPDPGRDYLYLGDIGDNTSSRKEIVVYRVPEPDPSTDRVIPAGDVATFRLTYPDGAEDAETLLVDPTTADLYVLTKSLGGAVAVYVAEAGSELLRRVGELDLGLGGAVTGGDIGPGRDRIVVRTYFSLLVWPLAPGEEIAAVFETDPCRARITGERQGEAVGFDRDGHLITVSEGSGQTLHRHPDPLG